MLKNILCFVLAGLLTGVGHTEATAQFFYKDIWNTRQLNNEMSLLKENKIKAVSIKSFDNDGEASEGFFCEKRLDKNYLRAETITRSNVTSQSLLTSYFNEKGLLIKTSDSTEFNINSTAYAYNENDQVIRVESFTRGNTDFNAIDESRHYIYTATGPVETMIRKKNNVEISRLNFKVDEKGNVVEEEEVLKNGGVKKYFYYYNDKNMLTDVVHYHERAKRLLPDYIYEYNTLGQIKQMITIEEGGGYYIWRYTYNDQRLRETERCLSKDKKLLGSVQYVYR